jgi:hypothetical protein
VKFIHLCFGDEIDLVSSIIIPLLNADPAFAVTALANKEEADVTKKINFAYSFMSSKCWRKVSNTLNS